MFLMVYIYDRQYGSIGSDNGLAPRRWQAIIWNNVGMYWHIYASWLGLNELILNASRWLFIFEKFGMQ